VAEQARVESPPVADPPQRVVAEGIATTPPLGAKRDPSQTDAPISSSSNGGHEPASTLRIGAGASKSIFEPRNS
jgi:hypothetical protein